MATELSNSKKRELARLLYIREDKTFQEIAEEVGSTRQTVSKWCKEDKWDEMRQSLITTNEAQIKRLYAQLDELQTAIESRPKGERYGNSKEVDAIKKLTASIEDLQSDLSIQDAIEVCKEVLQFVRSSTSDLETVKSTAAILDGYIKSKL